MKIALIDTDVLSEYFRGNKKVLKNIELYLNEYDVLNISVITYYEILNGLLYKDSKNLINKFNNFVELNNIVPLNSSAAKIASNIQSSLRKKGKEIGHTDNLIAGIAIANNFQLITNNSKHFSRIKDLEISNWTK
jgi:tRNA(fMet)-specific endonuclease VapC